MGGRIKEGVGVRVIVGVWVGGRVRVAEADAIGERVMRLFAAERTSGALTLMT